MFDALQDLHPLAHTIGIVIFIFVVVLTVLLVVLLVTLVAAKDLNELVSNRLFVWVRGTSAKLVVSRFSDPKISSPFSVADSSELIDVIVSLCLKIDFD